MAQRAAEWFLLERKLVYDVCCGGQRSTLGRDPPESHEMNGPQPMRAAGKDDLVSSHLPQVPA